MSDPTDDDGESHDADYFSEEAATFGDRVAAARDAAGFTQAQLAARLGVMEKTIRAWEVDRSEPRANKLQMLSGVLNVSMLWLLSGEGEGINYMDFPDDSTINDILTELRLVRVESTRLTSRIGHLEKRLRAVAS